MKKHLVSKDVSARPATSGPDELPRVAQPPVSGLLKKSSASLRISDSDSDGDDLNDLEWTPPSDEEDTESYEYSDDEAQGYSSE